MELKEKTIAFSTNSIVVMDKHRIIVDVIIEGEDKDFNVIKGNNKSIGNFVHLCLDAREQDKVFYFILDNGQPFDFR